MLKLKFSLIYKTILVAGSLGTFATTAFAETPVTNTTTPDVACLQAPAKMSDTDLQSFMGNPAQLLSENPVGGLPLSNRVRELAGSSSHAFTKVMDMLPNANDSQKSAIAAGLARVVFICDSTKTNAAQDYAAIIQAAVAAAGDPTFASTFQQSSKDVNVASVGPGAAGTSVGGGTTDGNLGQLGASNKYTYPSDGPIATTTASYTIGDPDALDNASANVSPTNQ